VSETEAERLARIEEMLRAHFERDEERTAQWREHEDRLRALEAEENRRKGGNAVLVLLMSAAGAAGGLVAKFIPWSVR